MRRRSPFPGLDPYLESHWGDVHHSLVQYASDALQEGLPDGLLARVRERVYLDIDDSQIEITEGYLEIRERDGGRIVTVIEFLSPANKAGGEGTRLYLLRDAALPSEAAAGSRFARQPRRNRSAARRQPRTLHP